MIVGYRGYGHFHINNSNCGPQKTVYNTARKIGFTQIYPVQISYQKVQK